MILPGLQFKIFVVFSNAKPSFMCNVELMPGDDTVKLKDVFKGFESLVLRGLFDLLEYGLDGTNTKITEHIWSPAHLIMLYITLTSSCFMSGMCNSLFFVQISR